MHYCRPSTKHIDDAEYDLFQRNQQPLFPYLLSVNNSNNEPSETLNTLTGISNKGSSVKDKEDAFDKVSPKRAAL